MIKGSKVYRVSCGPRFCYEVRICATSRSAAKYRACKFVAEKIGDAFNELNTKRATVDLMLHARVRRLPWLDSFCIGDPPMLSHALA